MNQIKSITRLLLYPTRIYLINGEGVFWKEAEKDYKKLAGMLKQWVDATGERLRSRGSEIGKDLGSTTYSKLAGFKELKNQKLGIRLIFKPTTDNQIEIIEIVALAKEKKKKYF